MPNINKDAVLNPFPELTDDVFKYVPRASTTEYGVVALSSGIKIDAFGKIYTDTSALQLQINQKAETGYVDAAIGAISTDASKQYATLALANADIANIALNQNIFVSEDVNGGYWYKATAGATSLTKSPYDPLTQAKADATTKANTAKSEANDYTNQKTKNLDESAQSDVSHVFTDSNENVIAYLKADGSLHLVGLDGSIQTQVANLKSADASLNTKIKNLDESAQTDVSHVFTDNNENVIAYIKNDGKLHIVGLNNALQTHITSLENRATTLEVDLQKLRDEVSVDEILIEKELVPQNYSIDADQALTIKCDYPSNIQGFFPDSPYRQSDSPTHPCVIELAKPLRGYKYLMVQTPYYENRPEEENPCVYGSNDMSTWKMLEDMPQPLDETPTWDEALEGKKGYLSDPWWTYDHITKELYCCYRKAYTVGNKTYNPTDIMQLLYRKTSNGIHWSKPQKLFDDIQNSVDPIISPAVIYDFKNKVWCMFYFKSVRGFAMRTNPDFRNPNTWSAPIDLGYGSWIAANNPPQLGWHLDVRYIGDRLFAMINDSTNAKLYLAYADKDDLTQWTFTSSSVLNTPPPRNSCYKGTFIAVPVNETQMKMHVVWTDAGGYRRLYNAQTFPISII